MPARLAIVLLAAGLLVQCTVNPATGRRQFNLISEAAEIKLGQRTDPQVIAQYGLYPDEAMQAYVAQLGASLASLSERRQLPWSFRVVDDPVVNAFAVPGGFVYITRGILAHLNSEAELVGVLGHEIGHITARHGVNQMSWNMAAQTGIGVAAVVGSPAVQTATGVAQTGVSVLFLKYGRDDERQADALSVRYALARDFDPRAMIEVFETLGRVSASSGRSGLPSILSTHPRSENRQELLRSEVARHDLTGRTLRIDGSGFLRRLEGLVFGDNPREGFFKGNLFVHPEMGFGFELPTGWQYRNTRQRVTAMSPDKDAQVAVSLATVGTASQASEQFFAADRVKRGSSWESPASFSNISYFFAVEADDDSDDNDDLRGLVSFVTYDERVLILLALARADAWGTFDAVLTEALGSIRRISDPALLDVQPLRLVLQQLSRNTSLTQLVGDGGPVPVEQLAIINHVDADEVLPEGRWLKIVQGKLPPS